jgi:hypothetical protein
MRKHIYTTVNGLEVEYQAISLDALTLSKRGIERKFRERGEILTPPTYTIKTAGGATLQEPHDAETDKAPEEQAAWDEYVATQARLDAEQTAIVMRYILDDGLLVQLPQDDAWKRKHEARFIELPTDPVELRDYYIMMEILPTKEDVQALTMSVLMLSENGRVDPDALDARLEMFRGRIQRAAAKRIDAAKKQMEAQSEIDGDGRGA